MAEDMEMFLEQVIKKTNPEEYIKILEHDREDFAEEINRLNNIINDVYEFVEWHYKDNQEFYKKKGIGLNYPECDYVLNKLKELKGNEEK